MLDTFTNHAIRIYIDPVIDVSTMTTQEIIDYFEFDIQYSYAQKIVSFVRQLKDNCFFSLPDGVQKAIEWTEENDPDSTMSVSEISRKVGVSDYYIRLAKTFLEMENRGYFDNKDAYDI